jgi:uncharacterized protein (TIGR00288 family)
MAIFCDFENVAIGAQKASYDELDIRLVLERLLDKGKIVVKKAYADWDRYKQHKRQMHEASFELIEIPHVSYSGKNSADIRLVVDALDLCYVKKHVDIFVIVSGDSDFSPLVSKLRENNKRVIGLGVKSSTSDLLIDNCDEFIYYDDLVRERREAQRKEAASRRAKAEVHRAEAGKTEPGKTEPGKTEPGKTEPGKTEPGKTEPGKTEPGRAEPGRAEPGRAEPGRAEPGRAEPGRAEANKPETTKAEAAKTEARGPRPAGNGSANPASGSFALPAGAAGTDGKTVEERQKEAIELVLDVVEALFQDRDGALHGALVKQTLKRKRPEFSERFHGYRTFNQLLEDAGRRGLLDLSHDESSGGYVVLAFGPNA